MHYATSLEEVLWGITLVAITMAIHGFGMLLTLFTSDFLKGATGRLDDVCPVDRGVVHAGAGISEPAAGIAPPATGSASGQTTIAPDGLIRTFPHG